MKIADLVTSGAAFMREIRYVACGILSILVIHGTLAARAPNLLPAPVINLKFTHNFFSF